MADDGANVSRRGFLGAAAALATGACAAGANDSGHQMTMTPGFPYLLDENGPKGIAVASWLARDRLALVLNDFQNFCILEQYGFTNDYSRARYADVVLPNTLRLVSRFREMGCPIVYTILATRHPQFLDLPGVCRKVLSRELKRTDGTAYHLRVGDEDANPPTELAPRPEDLVIVKSSSGAFNSSDIDHVLRNNGISSLVFTGGISELCLSSTVRGAYDCGYLCTVAEDATITGHPDRQRWAMAFLNAAYAWVAATDEVLKHLA